MKYFSRLFFISLVILNINSSYSVNARTIVLISYLENNQYKMDVERIIQEELGIPDHFISWKKEKDICQKSLSSVLHLCLKEKSFIVLKANQEILRKTFGEMIKLNMKGLQKEGLL